MTIPQIAVLVLAVATILVPAGSILYHDLKPTRRRGK